MSPRNRDRAVASVGGYRVLRLNHCTSIRCAALLLIVASFWSCSSISPVQHGGNAALAHSEFTDASIKGTYSVSGSLKPYVKFGGPPVVSGELNYDGRGNVVGHVVNFGVPADLIGTYQVKPDGTGTSTYTTTTQTGASAKGAMKFRIVNEGEIEFESEGSPNKDWASAATLSQSEDNGVFGTMHRKADR